MKAIGTVIATIGIGLAGCGELPLKESEVDATVFEMTSQIVIGQTDRATVRQELGAPWLASDYWGFDVYRVTDQSSAILLLMVPLPAGTTDIGYLMVSYGADGLVAALDQGIVHGEGSAWQGPNLVLQAGANGLAVEKGTGDVYVFIEGAVRDRYLETAANGAQCTVLAGCPSNWDCTSTLSIDGGERRSMQSSIVAPSRTPDEAGSFHAAVWPWLMPLSFAPGAHRIEILVGPTWRASASFHCTSGERLYARIEPPTHVTQEMPAGLRDHPMLVYRSGMWLVPQEPAP